MITSALAAIKLHLTLFPNDANRQEGTTTTYGEVLRQFLTRYATDTIFAKDGEKIRNVKQGSLAPWGFFQKLWDRTLRCGVIYNEQSIQGLYVDYIDLCIWSTMRQWWVDMREAILKDLLHQVQYLLDLQRGSRTIAAGEEHPWTQLIRRKPKKRKGGGRSHRLMAMRKNESPFISSQSACSKLRYWAQVAIHVTLTPSSKEDRSM